MSMSISSLAFIFSTSFMALFPVLNPLSNVFIINGFFEDLDDQQRKIAARKLITNYLLIGLGTLAVGHLFLMIFGLAIPIIQLGGGILICKTAMGLLSETKSSETKEDAKQIAATSNQWESIEGKLFYPITFPISIGPGSISVIFTLMATASVKNDLLQTSVHYLFIALVIVCMAIILYFLLKQGPKMMQKLGTTGNLIINKLVAFFTFCIGIQIIVEGISKIFHINVL